MAFFLYIASMRWVTRKPPKIFTQAKTNAISSVIVVGALLAVGVALIGTGTGWSRGFGFIALVFACVNIFGGFLVTQRMLAMYKKKQK